MASMAVSCYHASMSNIACPESCGSIFWRHPKAGRLEVNQQLCYRVVFHHCESEMDQYIAILSPISLDIEMLNPSWSSRTERNFRIQTRDFSLYHTCSIIIHVHIRSDHCLSANNQQCCRIESIRSGTVPAYGACAFASIGTNLDTLVNMQQEVYGLCGGTRFNRSPALVQFAWMYLRRQCRLSRLHALALLCKDFVANCIRPSLECAHRSVSKSRLVNSGPSTIDRHCNSRHCTGAIRSQIQNRIGDLLLVHHLYVPLTHNLVSFLVESVLQGAGDVRLHPSWKHRIASNAVLAIERCCVLGQAIQPMLGSRVCSACEKASVPDT